MAAPVIDPPIDPPIDLPADDDRARAAIARAAAGQLLNLHDLAAIFGVSGPTVWRWQRDHKFDQFLANPAIGKRMYSGTLVTRYLHGDPLYTPTFGRKTFDPTGRKK